MHACMHAHTHTHSHGFNKNLTTECPKKSSVSVFAVFFCLLIVCLWVVGCRRPGEGCVLGVQELHKRSVRCVQCAGGLGAGLRTVY